MSENYLFSLIICGSILIVYPYILYPLILILLSKTRRAFVKNAKETVVMYGVDDVVVLIAAYNEEKYIRSRIENIRSQELFSDVDIVVVSDGSTDKTEDIVQDMSKLDCNLHLIKKARGGKSSAIRLGLNSLEKELVVFTDANTVFKADAMENLISGFSDPDVGCVSGVLKYLKNTRDYKGIVQEGLYWKIETIIKNSESDFGKTIGANGAIYAARRDLIEDIGHSIINDDLVISLKILSNKKKVIMNSRAIAYEETGESLQDEFNRHTRDASGHFQIFFKCFSLTYKNSLLALYFYLSHRVLRWLSPIIGAITIYHSFIATLIYQDTFLAIPLVVFIVSLMILVIMFKGVRVHKLLALLAYFVLLNIAILRGMFRYISGRQKSTWETIR